MVHVKGQVFPVKKQVLSIDGRVSLTKGYVSPAITECRLLVPNVTCRGLHAFYHYCVPLAINNSELLTKRPSRVRVGLQHLMVYRLLHNLAK